MIHVAASGTQKRKIERWERRAEGPSFAFRGRRERFGCFDNVSYP
jgi:hypothetical protein